MSDNYFSRKIKLADTLEKEMGDHELNSRQVASADSSKLPDNDPNMPIKTGPDGKTGKPQDPTMLPEPGPAKSAPGLEQDPATKGPYMDPERNRLMNKVESESAMVEGSPEEEASESPKEEEEEDGEGMFRGMTRGKKA